MRRISRQNLHKAVWSHPLKQLAIEMQAPASAISTLCKKYDIPKPPLGYWTKHSLGKAGEPSALPTDQFAIDLEIELPEIEAPQPHQNTNSLPVLKVPDRLVNPSSEIAQAKKLYKTSDFTSDVYMYVPYQKYDFVAAVSVSQGQLSRALRILDTLFKYFKKRGWKYKSERANKTPVNVVSIDGQDIRFRIRELLKRQVRTLTAEEQARAKSYGYISNETVNVPTGNLILTIETWTKGCASKWQDKTNATLEAQLPGFVSSLLLTRDYLFEREKQRAEERKTRARVANLEGKVRQLQEQWNLRTNQFMSHFSDWQRAQQCRTFIDHVYQQMQANGQITESDQRWLEWARGITAELDPTTALLSTDKSAWSVDSPLFDKLRQAAIEECIGKNDIQSENAFPVEWLENELKRLGL